MKKIFKLLTLALMATFALASCEDVPEPYPNPNPNENGGGEEQVVEPVGDGSLATPYNVKALVDFINEGEYAGKEVYFKGIITSFKSGEEPGNSYGNSTFYISDNGSATNTFYVYRCYGLNGEKFSKEGQIVVGDTVVIKSTVTVYNGTLETEQNKGQIVSVNGKKAYHDGSETPNQPAGEAKGDGTQANPYNVAGVNAYLDGAYDDTKEVYFTGIISKFKSGEEPGNSYGNSTFYISEDGQTGGEDFYCYRIFGLNGEKFTSADQLKVGDLVVVKSPVTVYTSSYGSTKETVQNKGQLVSVNGKEAYSNGQTSTGGNTDQPDQPQGDVKHITIAQFLANADPNTTYELTGIVKNIKNTTYGNFDLVDETGSIYIYGLLDKEGKDRNFASLGISEGDEVTLTGAYKDYNGTAEIANAQFISMKKGEGGSDTPGQGGNEGGETASSTLENGNFEVWDGSQPTGWKSASTASSASLSQSTDAHSGKYAVAVAGAASGNKRLATQEITLEAGTYTFSFYAKATDSEPCQTRPGYVPVENGSVGSYVYGDYANLKTSDWTLVSYEFTLSAKTTVCLIVMNPKGSNYSNSQTILVDDATLVKK